MATAFILIFGLTVATCIIAYWSDNLGKKLGKKRVSLKLGQWSLRPRQTATLISMVSSVAIMLFTLAILMLFSRNVRDAVLRSTQIRAANEELQHQNRDLREAQSSLSRQAAESNRSAAKAQHDEQRATQHLQQVQTKLQTAQTRLQTAQTRLHTAQTRLHGAQQLVQTTRQRLKRVNSGLNEARSRLSEARTRLSEAKARLSETKTRLTAAETKVSLSQRRLDNVQRAVTNQVRVIGEQVKQVVQLEQDVAQKKSRVIDLETAEQQLKANIAQLNDTIKDLNTTVARLNPIAAAFMAGGVKIESDQVLAEQTVAPPISEAQARAILDSIMVAGNHRVRELGFEVLHLALVRIKGGGQQIDLSESEILDRLADYLATFRAPVSVRLLAARSFAAGEKEIFGRLVTVPVQTAYRRGETIASARIDGALSDAMIFRQLLALIDAGKAAASASPHNVVPLLTPDNPNFFAPGTNERIFEALRRIQAVGGETTVRLVAAEDLSTVESPRVRFEVNGE